MRRQSCSIRISVLQPKGNRILFRVSRELFPVLGLAPSDADARFSYKLSEAMFETIQYSEPPRSVKDWGPRCVWFVVGVSARGEALRKTI